MFSVYCSEFDMQNVAGVDAFFLPLEIGCPMRLVDLVLQVFPHRLAECRRLFSCEMLIATQGILLFYCRDIEI
jgi:hypothetical protein